MYIKTLNIKFLSSGLMRVTKCDGHEHWNEDYDDAMTLRKDNRISDCTCVKHLNNKNKYLLVMHP